MDKSRYTQITDIENTVNKENKSRSISTTSLSEKVPEYKTPKK